MPDAEHLLRWNYKGGITMNENRGKKILVALDGSAYALETVKRLSHLPSLQDREMVLFTVYSMEKDYRHRFCHGAMGKGP